MPVGGSPCASLRARRCNMEAAATPPVIDDPPLLAHDAAGLTGTMAAVQVAEAVPGSAHMAVATKN